MIHVLAVHGAWSSSASFNYLRTQIKNPWTCIDYDHSSHGMCDIIQKTITAISKPCVVLGHSLGGIAALHTHDQPMVRGMITLASPLAGLKLNLMQKIMSISEIFPSLLAEISTDSSYIRNMHAQSYTKPVQHLIATSGFNPFIYQPNDGVLPLTVPVSYTHLTLPTNREV